MAKLGGPPILVLLALTLTMGTAKRMRRRRRRTRGRPDERVAAGWDEVCDLARDMGDVVIDKATRRETAVLLARPGLADLARGADGIVFAPGDLTEADVAGYWDRVELTRSAMKSEVSVFARWTTLVNPTSLQRSDRPTGPDRGERRQVRLPGRSRATAGGAST